MFSKKDDMEIKMKKIIILAALITATSTAQACELDSFVTGVEKNTRGCDRELSVYGAPQPGGQCVSLVSSAEMLGLYLSEGVNSCSSYQKTRARNATSAAISTLRRAQSR